MKQATSDKLADALSVIPGMPAELVTRATEGYYDDYKSPLACPLHQLIADLADVQKRPATPRNSRLLIKALIRDVKDGEFDATREEAEAWGQSDEGQQFWREFFGGGR